MAFTTRIEINGAIDTSQPVLSNINKIAASTQTYVTWDPALGKFTTVLNRAGSSVYTFDDSNIIGSISISGTGINGVYNSARIGFTSKDQRGKKDERVITIPQEDRFAQELDNQLSMDFDLITDPVQAELLGSIELKQSRVDQVVEFATDYRAIGLRAGDIIGINNELYFYRSSANPKLFRIISIEEIDGEDGGILLQITGLEYDGQVYSTSGLTREERVIESGITPAIENVCIIEKENIATGKKVGAALQTDAGRAAITGAGIPLFETSVLSSSTADCLTIFGAGTGTNGARTISQQIAPYSLGNNLYNHTMVTEGNVAALTYTWQTANTVKLLEASFTGPQGAYDYTVNGKSGQLSAGIPCQAYIFVAQSPTGPWLLGESRYLEWSTYQTTLASYDVDTAPLYWMVLVGNLTTFDLSETASNTVKIDSVNSVFPASDGSGAALTLKIFLN